MTESTVMILNRYVGFEKGIDRGAPGLFDVVKFYLWVNFGVACDADMVRGLCFRGAGARVTVEPNRRILKGRR